jgi:hypothetical protein
MALPASADFTGTGGTAIRTLTNWDGAGSGVNAGACSIQTNTAKATVGSAVGIDWWTGDTFNADQKSSATVTSLASGTYIGVAVRCSGTDGGSNCSGYIFYSDSADGCYLEKYNAGAYTGLAGPGTVFAVNDVIEISVSGTSIVGKVNGVTRLTATDSALTSGAAGICAYGNSTSALDNWSGDNLGAGAPTVSVSDTVTLSETVTVSKATRAASVIDTVTLSEAVTVSVQAAISARTVSVSDTVALSEMVTVASITRATSVTDALTLSEAVTVAVQPAGSRSVNVSDGITLSEAVTVARQAVPTRSISVSETVTLTDRAVVLVPSGLCVAGVLTASSNARYFQNDTGIVLLSGFHTWYTMVDGGVSDPPPTFDYAAWLAFQDTRGGNVFKLWAHETPKDWPDEVNCRFVPLPWARTGLGNAADGKLKFDLATFDEDYFERMRVRAVTAGNAGYYVIVQLFQGWQADQKGLGAGTPAAYHPFAAANNINSIDGNSDDDTDILETRDTAFTAVYNLQKAYIDRVIATVAGLDNVLLEVSNEETATATVRAWQHALIDYIHANDADNHPVGMTWMYPNGSNSSDLYASNADWISYGGNDSTPLASPVVWPDTGATGKVSLWDTDHMGGLVLDPPYAWKAFCRGHNVLFMDSYDGTFGDDWTANASAEKVRYNLGYMQTYAALLDLANVTPQGNLSNTGYALAKTTGSKHQYLAYQPTSGDITLDLTGTAGVLTVEWLRPSTGGTGGGTTVAGGASRSLTNPWPAEDAVVYLWQSTYAKSVSDTVTLSESVTLSVSVIGTLTASAADTVTLGEAVTVSVQAVTVQTVDVADTVTLAEAVTVNVQAVTVRSVSVADTVTLAEAVTVALGTALAVSVADGVTLGESAAVTLPVAGVVYASVADAVTLTEAVTTALQLTGISAGDTVTLSEAVTVTVQIAGLLQVNVSDELTLTDAPATGLALPGVSVADGVTLGESVALAIGYIAPLAIDVSDALGITESLGHAMALPGVSVVDTVTVADIIIAYMLGAAHADWSVVDAAVWRWTLADQAVYTWAFSDRSQS